MNTKKYIPDPGAPIHPGKILLDDFLTPANITQRRLADAIHVPFQRVNEIVNGRRGLTPATALRLERFFGMSAAFWLNLQSRWDLYHAQQQEGEALSQIRPAMLPGKKKSPRNLAMVYRKTRISDQRNDRQYWLAQPPSARLAALEEIRREYHAWKYGTEPGFQRVLAVTKRQ